MHLNDTPMAGTTKPFLLTESMHPYGHEQVYIWLIIGILDCSLQVFPLLLSHLPTSSTSFVCYCDLEGPDSFPELEGNECIV